MSGALHAVPTLDGTLETAPEVLGNFSRDYGNLITGVPQAVLRPGSVQDIVKMVKYARRNGLKIAMNGQSGNGEDIESHSNYGQAAVPGGIAIDARGLSTIHSIGATSADVDAGVPWPALVDAALAQGKTPPALTDYVHLSIGGTASVGGIGGTVQKFGLQCDTVEEIEVVTGEGRLLTASATTRSELFNAVLAGSGQCGIIVRAKVKLIPAQTRALIMNLFYDDLPTYLADQEKILRDGRFSHQEGEIVPREAGNTVLRYDMEALANQERTLRNRRQSKQVGTPDASGWRYRIEGVTYYTPPTVPDQAALLADLRDDRSSLQVIDQDYRDWVFRLNDFEDFLKSNGFWDQPHPWLSLVLPASKAQEFVRSIISEITPDELGLGFVLFYPFVTSRLTRPLFVLPSPPEPVAYLFDFLPFGFPDDPDIPRILKQNRRFYDRAVALGGKRYVVGAIPEMTQEDWRQHFGRQFDRFVRAKERFDPDNVLTPGPGFFC
jgi:cytokinin dehydrogenase